MTALLFITHAFACNSSFSPVLLYVGTVIIDLAFIDYLDSRKKSS